MALIKPVRGIHPQIGNNCFLADNSTVVGEVKMGDNCSVWFNAVIRGDVHSITIGNNCNIQDGAIIHCTYQRAATVIGNEVSIAHNAIVHGCTIQDRVLIVAAGAVVLQNTVIEPGSIYAGNPAKFLKKVSPEQVELISRTANNYIKYMEWFKE
jgi:carbonic anhydrase/acetyltransferase-like protein (isoleucine patch superfamily)